MAGNWTSERFPLFEKPIRELTAQHRQLDEPLHLAISYSSPRDSQDIFLFEVVGGAQEGSISEDCDLFEVSFLSSSGFPMREGQALHLVLTNPTELKIALEQGWPKANELVGAVRGGDFQVLESDARGAEILRLIEQYAREAEGALNG